VKSSADDLSTALPHAAVPQLGASGLPLARSARARVGYGSSAEQAGNLRDEEGDQEAEAERQERGQDRPLEAAGLLVNGIQGGTAGLWMRLNSMRLTAVSRVQPPAWSRRAVSAAESNSKRTPSPGPTPLKRVMTT